ncbi:MAG: HepT-like ribonuclease domain-containing protein [Terracidiphilus sp.]|jgi:uncharacterized protein with HEPN domain
MQLEARKYLYDIQEAARNMASFTAGVNFAEYQRSPLLRYAVERAFGIIGEALTWLARVDSTIAATITDFRTIIAFRNILIHDYAQIDDRIVWEIVQFKLPVLIREVAALTEEQDGP